MSFASESCGREIISGIAEDVDEFGRLMIRDDDGFIRVAAAGEVTTRTTDDAL